MFLIFAPVLSFSEGIWDVIDGLPVWLQGIILAVAIVGYPVLSKIRGMPSSVSAVARSLHKGIVTPDRVKKVVEEILSGGKLPLLFINWVSDVAADLAVKTPIFLGLDQEQQIGILASLFGKVKPKKAKKLLPHLPDDVASKKYARKAVANGILHGTKVWNGRLKQKLEKRP
jgi:hypothetical protein